MNCFRPSIALVMLALSVLTCRSALAAQSQENSPPAASSSRLQAIESFINLPLYFETNRGQTDAQVKFLSRGAGYTLFLTPSKAVLVLTRQEPGDTESGKRERRTDGAVVSMAFVGANGGPHVSGREQLPGKVNYFIGNNPRKWRTNIATYAKVLYRDLYPGIDLVYHGRQGQLEYDLVIRPGADLRNIVLEFRGAERLEVDARGDLVMHTEMGAIRQRKPVVYQEINGARREIVGSYAVKGKHRVGFKVAAYDATRPLVIDPVLFYSTYLGGSFDDHGEGIAVDSTGNAYVTGGTTSSNFPTTPGAYSTTFGCCVGVSNHVFVTKLNPLGSAPLIYSTYIGANGDDFGIGIAIDTLGNAYVTGRTGNNFPTTPGAFQTTFGGGNYDGFVTKLNSSGSALFYSTYLGGSGDDWGVGIAVDGAGSAYVTGRTGSTNFPTTIGAFQTAFAGGIDSFATPGGTDAFVTKLNPAGSAPLLYSTYLGGSANDFGNGIAVDGLGNAYVTGYSGSTNFPTTAGAFQTTFGGAVDAFVTKLNPLGSAPLVYSTFLGGSSGDQGRGIAVDGSGNAYVTGFTGSTNFPTTLGAFQTSYGGNGDAFVTKLNPAGSAPLVYSTYLGGSNEDVGGGIAVDSSGNAYVTGYTFSTNFPTTPNAFQPTSGGGPDAFVTKLNPDGSATPGYSSYLGGSGFDRAFGIAVDSFGNAYVTGDTSGSFPTTPGAFQTAPGSLPPAPFFDAFVSKIAEVNLEECPRSGQGDCEQLAGGGEVDDNDNGNQGQGDFSFIARRPSTTGNISGGLQYVSPPNATRLQSVAITSLTTIGNTATLAGTCTNNGVPCTFVANVTDSGPIGAGDIFTISISGGPVRGGTLRSGKIQVRPR
jgi:hypothetical protein